MCLRNNLNQSSFIFTSQIYWHILGLKCFINQFYQYFSWLEKQNQNTQEKYYWKFLPLMKSTVKSVKQIWSGMSEAGGHPPPPILADEKAPPGSGGAPH